MSIDWSGNPEATHFDPVDQNFLREVGSALLLFNKNKGWTVSVHTSYGFTIEDCNRPLIKRPELDGEDLPPEGAQWFEPETDLDFGCFYKECDGATYMWVMNGHRKAWKKSHYNGKPHNSKPISEYIGPVAKPWDGEGLPPIGIPIEAKHKNAQPDWARPGFYETVIVAIGKQLVIFEADGNGGEKVGTLSDYIFRPIRTAEQIAAEEREATLTDIALLMGKDPERPMIREMAAILWDAGYRKQVQP